ncbi:hypothetical protein LRP49_11215 [Enterovibrio sp. ZSDZ35]|uniref:Uncharacterized protein n=1 Tax=Enterovibrio qingdaonensis TaxID=2899818 RepID=A0ABT5QLA5_9GAMM|nr:hypothetical protein [Enterovibrio sp. ZSDZ35]MDD1781764.1 hypothetical protein [Enterovibrio sp. ZSDZ35]
MAKVPVKVAFLNALTGHWAVKKPCSVIAVTQSLETIKRWWRRKFFAILELKKQKAIVCGKRLRQLVTQ